MRPKVKTARSAAIVAIAIGLLAQARDVHAASDPILPIYSTSHYNLHTDVSPDLARDLSQRLDAMFDEYSRRLGAFGAGDVDRHDVWVFTHKIDYMKFIDDRLPNTGGVFIPSRNCLAAFVDGQGRDALRRTLQHEAFHQFAHATISDDLPVWINEGIAQVFEEGIYTGRKFLIEQVPPRRLRQLKDDMDRGRLTPFEDFVNTDHKTWALNMRDRDRGTTQYNQAWAMTHFLVYAVDARTGEPLYRKRFFNMLTDIRNGVDAPTAFTNNFGTNFVGFQKRFVEYAHSLTATPEATYMENAEVLADLMIELRRHESKTFTSVTEFRAQLERGGYQLKYTKGQLRWTTNADIGTYFEDGAGHDLSAGQIGFVSNYGSPLPDLVMRPPGGLEYRARFYIAGDGTMDREILVRAAN